VAAGRAPAVGGLVLARSLRPVALTVVASPALARLARAAVRAYLAHFWSHWSGPDFELADARLDHLADAYAAPGAMTASIGWYRAGSGGVASALAETEPDERTATPTTVLWQEHDPLFPRLGRPARRVLQRFRPARARRRRPLHAARGAGGVRGGDRRAQVAKSGLAEWALSARPFGSSQSSWRPSAVRSRK